MNFVDAINLSLSARWPEAIRVNNQSYRDAKSRLKAFMVVVRDRCCADMFFDEAVQMVQDFLDYRRIQGACGTSIDNDRRVLSAMFTYLIRRNMLPFKANPAFKTAVHQLAPIVVRCKRALSDAEVSALLASTRDDEIYRHVVLCLATGLRPIGASRIRPEHIDTNARTIIISEKNRERIVPLSSWLIAELAAYKERGNDWYPLHPNTVSKRLRLIRERHGLPAHITMQSLRRTFLKKLFTNNVSPQLAARLAGNSLAVIEKHYVELETLNATSVVDCLNFGG